MQIIYSVPGPNCVEDTSDLSYLGNHGVSESGKACLPWVILSIIEWSKEPDEKIIDVQNFCRNVAIFDELSWQTKKPACATDADSGEYEYCDIPQCYDVKTNQTPTTVDTNHAISKLLDIKYILLTWKYICEMTFDIRICRFHIFEFWH